MKILKISGLMLLLGFTVFFGAYFFFGEHTGKPTLEEWEEKEDQHLEEVAFYQDLTFQLEKSLIDLREESYVAKTQYEERIAELELLLKKAEAERKETGDETEASAKPKSPYICTVSEGGVVINGYIGQETTISLPSHIDGLPVVGIGREAFRSCDLREIVLPDTVKRIDWFAFYQSPMLERVDIPTSVSKIEYGAFDGCDRITVVCERNSYADQYARSFGMKVVNELRH